MRMHEIIVEADDARRAKIGGDVGVNGYAYKGGQFLPSTSAPPGTWRVKIKGKTKLVSTKSWLVEPGKMEEAPSPYARAIFQWVREYVNIDDQGVLSLNERKAIAIDYYGREDLEKYVEMYNEGMRWIEVIPPDVEVIAK